MQTPSEKALDALIAARDGYHESIVNFLKLELAERDKQIERLKENVTMLETMIHDIRESETDESDETEGTGNRTDGRGSDS